MSTAEINGNGTINKPGLYRHEQSGAEVIVKQHPKLGSAQADGAVAVGYTYVGPAPVEAEQAATPTLGRPKLNRA